jgi:hypothetical protein
MIYSKDKILNSIILELVDKHNCHTVFLYGSRARGLQTATSDYDVTGICKKGEKIRIAKKQDGFFWDVFVYPEGELKTLGEDHFSWKGAKIIYSRNDYGKKLISRLKKLLKNPYEKQPQYQIDVLKIWASKQFERCSKNDIQGLYRRVEFLNALIDHYFMVRQKRFLGPKAGFAWLEKHDPLTYKYIKRSLKDPSHLNNLKSAAKRVYLTNI